MSLNSLYLQFEELAGLDKKYDHRRRGDDRWCFAQFLIAKCKREDWWYYNFVGLTILGAFYPFKTKQYGPVEEREDLIYVYNQVFTVRFIGNTKYIIGRTIPTEDLILV